MIEKTFHMRIFYIVPLAFIAFLTVVDFYYNIKLQDDPIACRIHAFALYLVSVKISEHCFQKWSVPIIVFQHLNLYLFYQTWISHDLVKLQKNHMELTEEFYKTFSLLFAPALQIFGYFKMMKALITKGIHLSTDDWPIHRGYVKHLGICKFFAMTDMMVLLSMTAIRYPNIYPGVSAHPIDATLLNYTTMICCLFGITGMISYSLPNYYIYMVFRIFDGFYIFYIAFTSSTEQHRFFENGSFLDGLIDIAKFLIFDLIGNPKCIPSIMRLSVTPFLILLNKKFHYMNDLGSVTHLNPLRYFYKYRTRRNPSLQRQRYVMEMEIRDLSPQPPEYPNLHPDED
ncbi:unnamed protein product [Caenorhabditis angaria]|uniref:Uncharacterized protein n=1 Tax=Caenorhabditis angaria TaxID=860376 RepID=A0A9P1J5P1_9PELO|nr:unnamed protein product [Caenorhabditis angaria]